MEIVAGLERGDRASVMIRTEHDGARPSVVLGAVHRGVGVAQQGFGGVALVGDGDTHARSHEHFVVPDQDWFGHRGQHAFGDGRSRARPGDVRAQQYELVAPEAGQEITGAKRVTQALRDGAEEVVAGRMTKAVVDDLEVVEVDEEHRSLASRFLFVGERTSDPFGEARAIQQPGHRVVGGFVLQAITERPPLADVFELTDGEHRAAVVVLHGRDRERDPHRFTVGSEQTLFDTEAVPCSRFELAKAIECEAPIVGVREVHEIHARERVADLVTEHLVHGFVRTGDRPRGIDERHADAGVVERVPEHLLGLP